MGNLNWLPLLQLLVLLLSCFYLEACAATDSMTFSQPLRDSETLVSSSQAFKLGFFSPANTSNRYVGIMFNVPVMTVIWVANRDKPLNDSAGTFTIAEDGNLVVLNGKKEILWSSNVSDSLANSTAQLLDTGSLVLRDSADGRIIWESFDSPTDSFVRSMRISAGSATNKRMRLTSWRSPFDPSLGDFSAGLSTFYTAQFFVWNKSKPFWRSGPWNGNVWIGVTKMNPVYQNRFQLIDGSSSESAYLTFTYRNDSSFRYYHLTSEGSIVEKQWQDGKKDWVVISSNLKSQCDEYCICGPFGSCNPQDSTICKCLPGFEPRDKEEWERGNWTGGCKRRTLLRCDKNSSAQDGYMKLPRMKVPDFAEWKPNLKEDCGTFCLENCSCIAYTYTEGVGCLHWSGSLIDIQQFSYGGTDLYIRVAHSELKNKMDMTVVISSTVVGGCLVAAVFAYICWKFLAKHKGKKQEYELSKVEAEEMHGDENNFKHATLEELPLYSYETLSKATDNFHLENKLGKGGFGEVYKGKLLDGQDIAVKRLSNSSVQGIEEFMNEVVVISKLQHRNLVRLLGCCAEREEKMLIYEYMPNRSLDAYLFDSSKQGLLSWSTRALIIEGIVRGLLYLHRDSRLKIIHRDLKASNILLDEELNPKISDFGLARIFGGNQDQANTRRVVGTYGYMAPEYAMLGTFSEKSDVFSFGVLLLEIITGRRNTRFSHDENEIILLRHAWKLWNEREAAKLIDPSIFDPSIEMEILRYVHVGLLCVQELAEDRPTISVVLTMLHSEISDLPRPKLPAFTRGMISIESSPPSAASISLTIMEAR